MHVISAVLLVAGLVVVVGSCTGMAVIDHSLDRLHLITPAAMLGSTGICASVEAAVTALLLSFAIQAHKKFGTLDPHELAEFKG